MKKELYKLTPEHEAQLKPWADKWIKNAMSTKAMDDEEKAAMRIAIKGMYEAAKLTPPPENRIVFVPSPFVARFAGGFAAAIWHLRKNKDFKLDAATDAATYDATDAATRAATRAATDAATRAATRAATDAATYDATRAATYDATDAATRAATYDATYDATLAATRAATDAATYDATYDATDAATYAATDAATYDATDAATDAAKNKPWFSFSISGMISLAASFKLGNFGLKCAYHADRMYQGGNFWSSWAANLSFYRHIVKLDLDYSKWDHFEKAAIYGSYRIMHTDFCIVSDRPEILTVDDQNRPHSYQGPYCKWRDGSALYAIHGVRVPEWIAETPKDQFTKEMILGEENADYRRCIIQKIGIEKAIEILGAKTVDTYDSLVGGKYELLSIDYDGRGSERLYLKMPNPSIGAVHIEGVLSDNDKVGGAICFRNKLKKFVEPEYLS